MDISVAQRTPADRLTADEAHIAGLLVQTRPAYALAVSARLAALEGTEVWRAGPDGKLVVVCECEAEEALVDLIGRMRDLPHVLNVALVYQQVESVAALDEEISDEVDAP